MITQEEFRNALNEERWHTVSKLTDDEIIELITESDDISASDALAIITKMRQNQIVDTKILILSGKEVDILQELIAVLVQLYDWNKDDEDTTELIQKIRKS